MADGGGCDDTVCNDFYGIDLMAQPGGALHLVPFADLAQEGWGAPTTFEPSQIHDLQWQVGLVPNAYDIAIDAVCFY